MKRSLFLIAVMVLIVGFSARADAQTLTVARAGTGTGTVTSTPAGINCGSDCTEVYPAGTVVTLTASPSAGSTFAGWSGACAGTGPCTVTMNVALTVTATFNLQQYTLTVARAGTGTGTVTSTPAGISCGADCTEAYPHGTVVVLTASPAVGSVFAGWSGGGCTGTGPCTVTMTAASTVTATFTLQQFTLSVASAGSGTGTIASSPAGINCGADCTENYSSGTVVTLTATPASGSTFAGWSGACTGVGSCTVSMTTARSVTANFTGSSAALNVSLLGTGLGTVTSTPAAIGCPSTCGAFFAPGTVVTLTATPASGSTFSGWSGACTGLGTCAVTVNAATNVSATFTASSFPLTIVHSGSGTISTTTSPAGINCPGACVASFPPGTTVSIAAIPSLGTTFSGFTGADSFSGNVASVLMSGPRTVSVSYRCAADFNGINGVGVPDIFDFLTAWFAGCP